MMVRGLNLHGNRLTYKYDRGTQTVDIMLNEQARITQLFTIHVHHLTYTGLCNTRNLLSPITDIIKYSG